LVKAFKYFDRSNVGTIDFNELKHVLTNISERLSPEEMNELDEIVIKKDCLDQNGRLLYTDLIKTMLAND
jgi:Ca2+-binding EF-hand superfamily protein